MAFSTKIIGLCLDTNNSLAKNYEKVYTGSIIIIFELEIMSTIEAYDIKARKKVSMKNPHPYLMKNGMWALKGTSTETGINLFKIVGKQKPTINQSKFQTLLNIFTSRQCECEKMC
jgi:hypothetical protein